MALMKRLSKTSCPTCTTAGTKQVSAYFALLYTSCIASKYSEHVLDQLWSCAFHTEPDWFNTDRLHKLHLLTLPVKCSNYHMEINQVLGTAYMPAQSNTSVHVVFVVGHDTRTRSSHTCPCSDFHSVSKNQFNIAFRLKGCKEYTYVIRLGVPKPMWCSCWHRDWQVPWHKDSRVLPIYVNAKRASCYFQVLGLLMDVNYGRARPARKGSRCLPSTEDLYCGVCTLFSGRGDCDRIVGIAADPLC